MEMTYVLKKGEKTRSAGAGIYRIQHEANGKFYIGSTLNLQKRFLTHRRLLEKGLHKNKILQNAWNKGASFTFHVLEKFEFITLADLQKVEQSYLDRLQPFRSRGYNICSSVIGPVAVKRKPCTPEHRQKLRIAALGRKQSQETKDKCRVANLGKPHSPERCRAISEGRKGIGLGVARPQAVRDKISNAQKGRTVPEERRKRIAESVKLYHATKGR
jgi:group I intron endonuclease